VATVLTPEDLAVAKYTIDQESPTRLDVVFHAAPGHGEAGDRIGQGTLTGEEAITFSGRRTLEYRRSDRQTPRPVDLEIVPRGAVFDLAVHADGAVTARGMGIRDPGADGSLLVSWWTGDRRPAGIVKYTVSPDRPDTVRAVYTSIMSESQGFDDVLRGTAHGDTSGGFPGGYTILYEGLGGTSFGPYAWEIVERGEVLDLTWTQDGNYALRGFGFNDPHDPGSIIVNYWGSRD
jgi:hypothetical protein